MNNTTSTVDSRPLMVSIRCITYNHEPYIRQCLDGFVMQKTNFRFEAIVHDDASTDGTAAIIREYAEKYPDIIKPIFETENQYSKHDGSLRRIMNKACTGKYIAMCEGDDYWTDPNKLQIQVDFMESHPNYSMCCHNVDIMDESDGTIKRRNSPYKKDTTCRVQDIIEGGGGFFPTNSIVYRRELMEIAPEELFFQYVGDYPLQLYLSFAGEVYYFAENMGAYRANVSDSWSQKISNIKGIEKRKLWLYEKKIYDDFNKYSLYKYDRSFKRREYESLFWTLWNEKDYMTARRYWHKMSWKKRPWKLRWVLHMYGYGEMKNLLKSWFSI